MTLSADSGQPGAIAANVRIVDSPAVRVHRVTDALHLGGTLAGIALVLLIGAYASGTTAGLTEDVQGFSSVLRRLLVIPVNAFEGLVTLGIPTIVIVALAVRREPRRIVETLATLIAGVGAVVIVTYTTKAWGSPELIASLTVDNAMGEELALPAYVAGLSAMLTVAGRRDSMKPLAASWNILFLALTISAISNEATLPAALATVLIGRAIGLCARYVLGTASDRAYGDALVRAISRAGFEAATLVRADHGIEGEEPVSPVSAALARTRSGRLYELTTIEGHGLFVIALDGDQQVAGSLVKAWRALRLRGVTMRADVSLRHSAEATALVSHAARSAGVHTARVMGMAMERDTIVLVYQRPEGVVPVSEVPAGDIDDAMLDAIWHEVRKAHVAGIAHRRLSGDTVMVGVNEYDPIPVVWLTSWELGEVASSTLARRMDLVQVLAMFATRVGARRAVDSAFRCLPEAEISAIAPLLQTIVLPRATRVETKARGPILAHVRDEILERLPEAPATPENVSRFGVRTIVSYALIIVAILIAVTSFKGPEIVAAFGTASPWWIVVVVGWTMLTYVGAALAVLAFSPVRLPVIRVLLAQMAAAYVALSAPAGVGPAAINLRLLTQRNVHRGLAVATVALVQVSSIVITFVGLFVLSLVTGTDGALASLPSGTILFAFGAVVLVLGAALLFPRVRKWSLDKIMPTVRQTWPRLVQILGQPWRLALGLLGNLLQTAAFIGALDASLRAFGQDPALVDVAVLFLLGNAAGALIPTPGGIGTVEVTLTTGLKTAGVGVAIAGSSVALFRAVTYWGRIPLGYVAMRYLQREGEL